LASDPTGNMKNESYLDQFTGADLSDALEYIDYCYQAGITIDIQSIQDPILFADLSLIVIMLNSRNQFN